MKHDCVKPKQIDFLTLVQWLDSNKNIKSKFDLTMYHVNYRLIPFGNEIYGLYKSAGFKTFDEVYSLNVNIDDLDRSKYNNPIAIIKFNKSEYKMSLNEHNKYWTWFTNKNEKRFINGGTFDTKHAMHLVRLLRTGLEILQTGKVLVHRLDAKELLDIRNGSMTYDEILEYSEYMDNEIKKEYKKTSLKKDPDITLAANILMDIQDLMWN